MDRIVIRVVLRAIEDGDHSRAEWILQRLVGKVKDQVEVSVRPTKTLLDENGNPRMVLGQAPTDEDT